MCLSTPVLLPALCPTVLVVRRGPMGARGGMEEEDVRPSLISMVRKVFMSGWDAAWLSLVTAVLPGVCSASPKVCLSFSAVCLAPPTPLRDWSAEDWGWVATPRGQEEPCRWLSEEEEDPRRGLPGRSAGVLRGEAVVPVD